MSTIPFTNTTGDGQVPGVNPDATTDYFLITDYNNDKNYWNSKLCELIKLISQHPDKDFQIIYGGLVTNAGGSKVNISEGAAIGKDEEDNFRIITIPNLTNVSLPNDWNDDRQIWVVGKYNTKLNSAERQHFNGTDYQYQLLDSYLGESNSNNLFVYDNPYDTVVKWGSFKMNGTAFTNQNDRSQDWNVSNGNQPGDIIETINGNRAGCLPCYGGAYSRAAYSDLFAVMPKEYGSVTFTLASPTVLTLTPSHNDSNPSTGNTIQFTTTGNLPSGILANTIYYLRYTSSVYHLYDTLSNAMNLNSTTGRIGASVSQSGTHSYEIYYFGNGNGSTTFNVPDLRGVVPRGIGTSNGYIANVSILAGQRTDDQLQGHRHTFSNSVLTNDINFGFFSGSGLSGSASPTVGDPITDGTNGTPRTGSETRSKSLGVYYAIKY